MEKRELILEQTQNRMFALMVMAWCEEHPGTFFSQARASDLGITEDQLYVGLQYLYFTMGMQPNSLQ